jgi:hypothetical protein
VSGTSGRRLRRKGGNTPPSNPCKPAMAEVISDDDLLNRPDRCSEIQPQLSFRAASDLWDKTEINIAWRFRSGKIHLKNSYNKPGRFKLTAKKVRNRHGVEVTVQYLVSFSGQSMPESWRSLLLTPLGRTEPPVTKHSLPPWDNTPQTEAKYFEVLDELYKEMGKSSTDVRRLEALFPVVSSETVAIDAVRLVYLKNVMTSGANRDLVVIYFNYYKDGIVHAQNGGGSGPPN